MQKIVYNDRAVSDSVLEAAAGTFEVNSCIPNHRLILFWTVVPLAEKSQFNCI